MALDKNAVKLIEEANPSWAKDAADIIKQLKDLKSYVGGKSAGYIEYLAAKADTPNAKTASDIFKNIKV